MEWEKAFAYDSSTGEFRWLIDIYRGVKLTYKAISKGQKAGSINGKGYVQLCWKRKLIEGQRLAWYLYYGEMPNGHVDHRDGNPANNRIDNLRLVTRNQNGYNRQQSTNNTSGVKGVSWNVMINKWQARLQVQGKRVHVGYFTDLDDARIAIEKARLLYHGEYANHGI